MNSWDGLDITYSFLDPTSFGKRDKVKGQFWVDIYDTDSVQRMIQIEGSFKGTGPFGFQWDGTWFGSRYYVLPLGKTNYFGPGLHRLLVCDTGSGAGGQSEKVLRERERTLPVQTGPPVPIAELVSFTDAPVSDPSNGQIREVRVTASVNVRWDGQYRLFLRLSGPDGKYIWENVVAKLASGPGQLTVRFPASQVAALGVDGPYTIERATLTIDSAGNALAAYKHLAGTTQAYRLSSLNRGGP